MKKLFPDSREVKGSLWIGPHDTLFLCTCELSLGLHVYLRRFWRGRGGKRQQSVCWGTAEWHEPAQLRAQATWRRNGTTSELEEASRWSAWSGDQRSKPQACYGWSQRRKVPSVGIRPQGCPHSGASGLPLRSLRYLWVITDPGSNEATSPLTPFGVVIEPVQDLVCVLTAGPHVTMVSV